MPQIPSFKHLWEDIKLIPKMTTILVETHIPSIRNKDAAKAARALVMLCFRAAQPTLSQSDSMLVCSLRCVELTPVREVNIPALLREADSDPCREACPHPHLLRS